MQCSVFSNIFECNHYFWQLPDDCPAWGMKLRVANNLTLASSLLLHTYIRTFLDHSLNSAFQGKWKQIMQMNITWLRIPTGRRQTSSLFTNVAEELNWGLPRNNSS